MLHRGDIELAGYTLSAYGVLRVTALLVGLLLAVPLAHGRGLHRFQAFKLGILLLFVALLGTKLALVMSAYWTTGTIAAADLWRAGGGFYYGLIPALGFAVWYLKRSPWPTLRVLDAFSPSVALGLAIARLGCFLAGCCYGKPIRAASVAALAEEWPASPGFVAGPAPRHPVQLYEALAAFLIFLVLLDQFRRQRVEGEVFCRMLMLLAAARLILEFFRGDDGRGFLIEPVLSIPQVISLLMLVTGLSLWWQLNQTSPKCPQQESGASSDLEKCL